MSVRSFQICPVHLARKIARNWITYESFFFWSTTLVKLWTCLRSERTAEDLKHHQIFEFGKLWRLPEGKDCKIRSFLWRYKLFKISFLTTLISIKTLYDKIWNIFVDHICQIFEFFVSGKFWRLLKRERCILEINVVQNDISDNFYYDYKAVQFDYKAVFYFR